MVILTGSYQINLSHSAHHTMPVSISMEYFFKSFAESSIYPCGLRANFQEVRSENGDQAEQ